MTLPPFKLDEFTRGLALPLRGAAYLMSHRGLKRYAALPLVVNILLYALALVVFFYFLWNWQVGEAAWEFWGPVGGWLSAAANWMRWTIKVVVAGAAVALSFFTFTGVGMVLASPLNDILSEKVEAAYTSSDDKINLPFRSTTKGALLSVYDSMGTLLKQLAFTLLTLPFLLVPLVGFLPLLLVGSYFGGFGFVDSAMARNFLRPRHKKLIAEKLFWEIIGFGLTMQAAFAIPFLGIILMPVGVTAGTLVYCSADWDELLSEAGYARPAGFVPPKKEGGNKNNRNGNAGNAVPAALSK